MFNDTIYNNVVHGLYGTEMDKLPETKKRELVRAACIEANADSFIQQLPSGYDTKVGDRGGFFSGGQRQRIAIARSIISDPRILLLDEATSALDPSAEGVVQAALDNVSKSRTTVMIAHRLSTVKKADKIIVLSRGRVVEEGTHSSLLEAGGAYASLVNAQTLGTAAAGDSTNEDQLGIEEVDEAHLVKSQSIVSEPDKKPEESIEDVSRKLSLFRCITIVLYEQRHHWPLFLCGGIASIAGGGAFPAQAVIFSRIVTVFSLPIAQMASQGTFWSLMFFVLALGVLVSYASIGLFLTIVGFLAARFYRSEYFGAMLRQDVGFYDVDGQSAGAMVSRLSTDPQRLHDLVSINLGLILIVIVDLFACCALALALGWRLAIVAIFGCIPPLFFAGFVRMRLEMQSQDRNSKLYQESTRFAAEAVGAIRTVSSLTLEGKILDAYASRLNTTLRRNYRTIVVSMFFFGLSESLDLGASGLAFWYGAKLLSEGYYNAQTFFLVFMAVIIGGQAAGFLFGFTLNTTKAHAAANHIIDLRRSQPPISTSTGVMPEEPDSSTSIPVIEFKNVRFIYPSRPDVDVLRGLNLSVKHGQNVGVVGASGCGKTTIVSLLERFYDIDSGSLLIHGRPIKELDVHAHRAMLGMVSQDTILFQGSIRENVLLGLDNRNEQPGNEDEGSENEKREPSGSELNEAVITACKAANIHDFISSLPEGYETDAGTRGVSLSGGQRQRIAIARALIRDPSILLFDEATSALDTQSEIVVQRALETASKGRTAIIVAHRLSTIRKCDVIFVVDRGRVVEQGTHDELVRRKGVYAEMVKGQSLDREVT